jgi:hypothetical protein
MKHGRILQVVKPLANLIPVTKFCCNKLSRDLRALIRNKHPDGFIEGIFIQRKSPAARQNHPKRKARKNGAGWHLFDVIDLSLYSVKSKKAKWKSQPSHLYH